MIKYIVKNFPATYQNFENKFVCTSQIKQNGFPFYCQNCTDCLIKQIVERANLCLTPEVIELLEIEECE